MLFFRAECQINSVERQRANTTCVTTITGSNRDEGVALPIDSRGMVVDLLCFCQTKE